jgi:hypothetical protein
MTRSDRNLYRLAIGLCLFDIALCALVLAVDPHSKGAAFALGLCIACGAVATQRLQKAKKVGVRA